MKSKRDRADVIYDILRTVQNSPGGIKTTHLLYKTNLSYKLLQGYIEELENKGMIVEMETNSNPKKSSHKTIHLTEHGQKFLAELRRMKKFMESFGL